MWFAGICSVAPSWQVISVASLGLTLWGLQVVTCEVIRFMVAELQKLAPLANEVVLSAALNHRATHQV